MRSISLILMLPLLLTAACTDSQLDRLARVGDAPEQKPIENPVERKDYQPVSWPMPKPYPENDHSVNSLWQSGSRTFFRDPRARFVGDILRVNVSISDNASLANKTTATRAANESMGAPALFGMEKKILNVLPGSADPSSLLSVKGATNNTGEGQVDRKETINVTMAATVTQVLPNNNLVIEGRQQVRVNNENRILYVQGVVRPEDISSDNTIDSNKIAEARISYGGEGAVTDLQQPRLGSQIIDILSPF